MLKAARTADVARGEFQPASREGFTDYAAAWVERHHVRESTREDYRALLRDYALPYFAARRLTDIGPADIAEFIAWLGERRATDASVRKALVPVRACFAAAVREGRVRHNPTAGAALPRRERVRDDDDEQARALTREQLAVFLAVCHPRHRLLFRLLAGTGLRVSEAFALQWRHLHLDGSEPCVRWL